jgi:hypothetical protein
MGCVQQLRAKAQKLYEAAAEITTFDERLVAVLRAVELKAKADMLKHPTEPFFNYQPDAGEIIP